MPSEHYVKAPADWRLPQNEVHVWRFALEQPTAELELLRSLLSDDERAKADRFHFDADRVRHTVGRGWLRRLLGRCLETAPEKLAFAYGRVGKPSLAGIKLAARGELNFNIAHSHECVLVALAWNNPLGIDVEFIRAMPDAMTIGRRHFTPSECRLLETAGADRDRTFFRLWTRKEAVIKAVGTGLATPLYRFDVSSIAPTKDGWFNVPVDEEPRSTWAVRDLPAANGYCSAIALERLPVDLCFWQGTCWSD